ncbi:MAG: VOC family protein [Actinomycetota bacterium]|nr:VOC family protein [Actinomycetota bacterium]
MPDVTSYASGTPSWVDLGTTDADAAKTFYTSLFGWTAEDLPSGEDSTYTMLKQGDKAVAALYEQSADMREGGVPPAWLTYVSVDDVDAAAAQVPTVGGTVMGQPFDVLDSGRMVMVQEPSGSTFALWQAGNHAGAQLVNEPGAMCWNEVITRDTKTAASFFSQLLGWSDKQEDMGETTYFTFSLEDREVAGMMPMTEEMGDVPPSWLTYFAVEDCDAAVASAKQLGAEVISKPMDVPPGRFACLRDPQGAHFAVIALSGDAA